MNYLLLFCSLLPVLSLKHNLCIDCKFFKRHYRSNDMFSKCSLFPTMERYMDYFITGKGNVIFESYHFCSTARKFDDMCGEDGKKFVPK